jgi:ATP-dependent Clp protease protease subunit
MDVLVDGEIVLYGTVGDSFWDEGFSALDVVQALAVLGRATDVTVRINSPGGNAYEGAAIFNALNSHSGAVNVVVDSVAASAASLIAMAGDSVTMRPGSVMMIHDPAAITFGDSAAHQKSIEALEALAGTYADVYAEKAGLTADEARADMVEETWFTPQQAVDRGYADGIGGADDPNGIEPVAFDYRLFQHAPENIVALVDQHGWARRPRAKAASSPAKTRRSKEKSMATTQTADLKAVDTATPSIEKIQEKLMTAELDKAKADAAAEARAAERSRISSIMNLEEAKGREGLASHFAHETEMSADQAKAALTAAPKASAAVEPTNRFEAAMDAAGNPRVGADGPHGDETDDVTAVAGKIVTMYRGPAAKRSA